MLPMQKPMPTRRTEVSNIRNPIPHVSDLPNTLHVAEIETAVRNLVAVLCNPRGELVAVIQNASAEDLRVAQASLDTLSGFVGMGGRGVPTR